MKVVSISLMVLSKFSTINVFALVSFEKNYFKQILFKLNDKVNNKTENEFIFNLKMLPARLQKSVVQHDKTAVIPL
jgi:hypothetical protein